MALESNAEGVTIVKLVNKIVWVVGGRPNSPGHSVALVIAGFQPNVFLQTALGIVLCPQKAGVIWLLSASSALVLGPNTMGTQFDHVLFLLIIVQQKNYIPSKDKIIILPWSPSSLACPTGPASSSLQHQPLSPPLTQPSEGLPAPYVLSIASHPLSTNSCSSFRPLFSHFLNPPTTTVAELRLSLVCCLWVCPIMALSKLQITCSLPHLLHKTGLLDSRKCVCRSLLWHQHSTLF